MRKPTNHDKCTLRLLMLLMVFAIQVAAGAAGPPRNGSVHRRSQVAPASSHAASPAAVIQSLYKLHNKGYGKVFDLKGKRYLDRYFTPSLAKLIWKNLVGTPSGEVGNLDFDPLYSAQDIGVTAFHIGAPRIHEAEATSAVTFKNFDHPMRLVFHLRKAGTGWKISNIDYGGGENLVKVLSQPLKH